MLTWPSRAFCAEGDANDTIIYVSAAGPKEIIIDNGDSGASFSGTWQEVSLEPYYGGTLSVSYQGSGEGDSFTFEASINATATVYLMWYANWTWGSDEVYVEIYDGATVLSTVRVDQTHNGGSWNNMGTYTFTGEAKVVITKDDNLWASVDALKFTYADIPGSSWEVPFEDLNAALDFAEPGNQIWVASGMYVPGATENDTFLLKPNIRLYGGFAGSESLILERDILTNATLLDGSNFTRHVVTMAEGSTINGFLIQNGCGDENGAGLIISECNATVESCWFTDNYSQNCGGAVFVDNSPNSVINQCAFTYNYAAFGGALCCVGGTELGIRDCEFSYNEADFDGGAIYQASVQEASIADSNLSHNFAAANGGAVMLEAANLDMKHCSLSKNDSAKGGAVFCGQDANAVLTNCEFLNNTAGGAGIYAVLARLNINNCVVNHNHAPFLREAGTDAGGIACINTDANISRCSVSYNSASGSGGALLCEADSFVDVKNSIIWANTAGDYSQVALRSAHGYEPDVAINYCDIEGGFNSVSGTGQVMWGPGNIDTDPLFAPVNEAVCYWKFDEDSGSDVLDSAGMNHGTIHGATRTAGWFNAALQFDGADDYVLVPNSETLQLEGPLTICAWVVGYEWGTGYDVDVIARKGGDNPNNYQLAVADGRLSLMLDESDNEGSRGNTILRQGQWYHVAATWDQFEVRLYVDGVLDKDPPDSRIGFVGTDTRPLYIGAREGADLLDGVIDDVQIYDTALPVGQIRKLMYPNGLAGYDCHLQSEQGRWDPNNGGQWVTDANTSPCVDAGNPGCPVGAEPSPDGNRINIGPYAGTDQASKSPDGFRSIADLDNDFAVGTADLGVFVDYWLEEGSCLPPDFDHNGFVEFEDFAAFATMWLSR
ncbi:MAG: DUF1565 domain-containing protein [Deltaproteobacteria bacterium]|nr:DUF1565 domain-containing protein [Deltaproteobacteria bacterium]